MSRNTPQQRPPAAGLDLSTFPTVTAPKGVVYRAYGRVNGPGYYSNQGSGRFDLSGADGTMYFGDDIETAIREAFGDLAYGKVVSGEAAVSKAVAEAVLPWNGPYANVAADGATRFGIIRELQTMSRYAVPQAWAEAFHAAGFAGIRYQSRFTTGERANAWAVFGPAGQTDLHTTGVISGLGACQQAGIEVADTSTPPMVSFTFETDGTADRPGTH